MATQTKLQITLGKYCDIKKLKNLFTLLNYFKDRYKNELINDAKASQLLKKFFKQDFMKIREFVKESSIHKQMNDLNKHKSKYAAPGYGEVTMSIYSYLISLLSFEYEQHNLTLANYIENNAIEGSDQNDPYIQEYARTYEKDSRMKRRDNSSQRALVLASYSQPREPIEAHQNPERIDIEKRIYIDSLKRHLSNRFEKEPGGGKYQGGPGDLRAYFKSDRSRFSTHMPHISKNRMSNAHSTMGQRRTTNPSKHRLIRISNEQYHTSQQRRHIIPNMKSESHRSGPLYSNGKMSRRRKRDTETYK